MRMVLPSSVHAHGPPMTILGLQLPIDTGPYTFEVPPPATGYNRSLLGIEGQKDK